MYFIRLDQPGLMRHVLRGVAGNNIYTYLNQTIRSFGGGPTENRLNIIFRAIRMLTGILILLVIVITILIPQVLPVSGNSYVNAKLEWIRTPIEGDLAFGDLSVGDKIEYGDILGVVSNKRSDDFFLNQLKAEKQSLDAALFSLESRKRHLTLQKTELLVRVDESLEDLEVKTGIRVDVVENELTMAKDELASVTERLLRYQRANTEFSDVEAYSVVSRAAIEALADRKSQLQTSIASQETTMSLLQSNLDSALSGSFVSQDTPLEQRQLIDIERALLSVEAEIDSLLLKSGNLSTQIGTRVETLHKNTHYEMVAGVSGTLWDIGFPDGSYVNHGDSVVAIADTKTIVVEGNFHQRYLDNIKVGDPATVDLMGSGQRIKGSVLEVKIRDQIKSADLSAFNLDSPASNEFKVVVSLGNSEPLDIYIGQRAKLIISKSSSSMIPSLLMFFNR